MAIERWGSLSVADHTTLPRLLLKSHSLVANPLARNKKSTFGLWAFARSLVATPALIQTLKKLAELQNRAKSEIMSVTSKTSDNI